MVRTPYAPATATPAIAQPSLDTQVQAALEHARRLTDMYGTDHIDVALAWETVEELETARDRQRTGTLSSLERYCVTHPDAPECRLYED